MNSKKITMAQTAVQWMALRYHHRQGYLSQEDIEEAKQMEEQQLKDAIMHALDEDGHTGDWKIKFANEYIKNLKWIKTK